LDKTSYVREYNESFVVICDTSRSREAIGEDIIEIGEVYN